MKPFEMNPFRESDIPVLTEVMTRAFNHDSMKALGKTGGPPGYDDGSFLKKWAFSPGAEAFRIDVDGSPGGCAIIWLHPEKEMNFLGCLFLDVPLQGIGIGTEVWKWLETHYPAKIWEVETPGFSKTNHHFYVNKCGFEVYRIENPQGPEIPMYKMHKIRHGGPDSPLRHRDSRGAETESRQTMTIQERILLKLHTLGIPALADLRKLNELPGSYINLECRLPNGKIGKLLDDGKTYFGAQVERADTKRCYGVAADAAQIAIYEYGCGGADAELILWTKI